MSEIIRNLYLGNDLDARNAINVDLIINCTHDLPFYSENTTNIRVPIQDQDNDDYNQQKILFNIIEDDQIFKYMNIILENNKKVLVHCKYGQQRSCAFVVCFLIWRYDLDLFDAISYIKSCRKEAFFGSINFMDAIKHYSRTH